MQRSELHRDSKMGDYYPHTSCSQQKPIVVYRKATKLSRETTGELWKFLLFLLSRWSVMIAYACSLNHSYQIGTVMLRYEAIVLIILYTTVHRIVAHQQRCCLAIEESVRQTIQTYPTALLLYGSTAILCDNQGILGITFLLSMHHLFSIFRYLMFAKQPIQQYRPLLPL